MNNKGNLTNERPPLLPVIIGTGFGSGFWPWGPGTAGSVLATLIWALMAYLGGFNGETLQSITFFLVILSTLLGTWATARLQPYWGEDPSRVVIDEMAGVWIPLSLITPFTATGTPKDAWWWALVALVPLLRHGEAAWHQVARPQRGSLLCHGRRPAGWILCSRRHADCQNHIFMGKIKQELVTFGKAELTASIASIVDFGLAFFLSDIIGIYYGLANALGVMSGGITNCTLNYRYVFGDSKRKKKSVAWRYFIIWALSWTLNSGGTIALTEAINLHEHVNIHYMIPKCVVSFLVAVLVNYPGQRKFVFKKKDEEEVPEGMNPEDLQ